jgi:hypothetical protein
MDNKMMNYKKTIATLAIALVVATATTLASNAGRVQAYTSDSLTEGTTAAYHVASISRMMTLAIETCTSQMTAGDTSNVDTCVNLMKTFDRHMTDAMTESNADIHTITGYGLQ